MLAVKNEAHIVLEKHLRELGCQFEREYRFDGFRRWRFDFLVTHWPDGEHGVFRNTAIEIEGAVWTQGRHTRGSGFVRDLEKYRHATMLGYRVLRFSTQEVLTGKAKEFLEQWSKA